jgi:hypothetical protein
VRLGYHKSYTGGTGSSTSNNYGPWSRNDNAYVGIKFTDGDGTHLGWAEISTDNNYKVTLNRFAYETDPNKSIKAGQTFEPLQINSVGSRKTHGVVPHDVDLPFSTVIIRPSSVTKPAIPALPPGIECRSGGMTGDFEVVFTFNNNMTAGNASVSGSKGSPSVGSVTFVGKEVHVFLNGIDNAQRITITLSGAQDENAQTYPDITADMGVLLGDTNADASVNSGDITQTKGQSGQTVGASNFREDLNVDNALGSGDITTVKGATGTGLPPAGPMNVQARASRQARVQSEHVCRKN